MIGILLGIFGWMVCGQFARGFVYACSQQYSPQIAELAWNDIDRPMATFMATLGPIGLLLALPDGWRYGFKLPD